MQATKPRFQVNVARHPYRVIDNRTGETVATYKTFNGALRNAGKRNRLDADAKS
jgi:hypothetical protein